MQVYKWFVDNGSTGYYNKVKISQHTGIAHNTIRKIESKFSKLGLIYFGTFNIGIKLTPYKINTEIKVIQCPSLTVKQDKDSLDTKNPLYSSSKFLKTNELTKAFSENPEFEYWKEKKLKPSKVEAWMNEFSISEEDMIESLCHCAFDMINNKEKDKKGNDLKSVMDWFYSIIKKNKYYDKPKNYKTPEEVAIERAQKRLKDKEERLSRLKEIEKKEKEADFELKYMEMMSDIDSELYMKCIEALPKIHKKRYEKLENRKGSVFEMEMKNSLKKVLSEN